MADIGAPQREVTFEPLEQPQPQPAEPAREPEREPAKVLVVNLSVDPALEVDIIEIRGANAARIRVAP